MKIQELRKEFAYTFADFKYACRTHNRKLHRETLRKLIEIGKQISKLEQESYEKHTRQNH